MTALNIPEILLYGLTLCTLFSAFLLLIVFTNPRIMLHDAPPEVQAQVPPQTAGEKRQAILLAIPLFTLLGLLIAHSTAQVIARTGGSPEFLPVFLNALLVFEVFNLFDLVVIDYFVLLVWKPSWIVMPGGEAITSPHTLAFHVQGFMKGHVIGIVMSLITALVALVVA